VDCNAQAEILFGRKRTELIGKQFSELIDFEETDGPHDVRAYLDSVIKMFSKGRVETTARNRDGREFPVELAISAFNVGKGSHFAAFLHDVTDRKKVEEEREKARAEPEAASHAKDDFLANMSHEIRTPLNGIIGMTDLALDTPHTEEQQEYLETVKFSADSLLTIINDILDFSKIEAGKMDLELIDFNLRENLELTLKTLAQRAGKKGLELLLDFSPAVPEFVRGDPSRLRQIILNLAGNSIKFTEYGEVGLAVQCDAMEPDHCILHFIVSDTGIGIPPEKHKTIFEAFSQADSSTTRKYGGTGLGLTISARLVEIMGGKIWVESEVGRGTQFHFTTQMASAKMRAADSSGVISTEKLKGLRTLIVDDNAANRRILRTLLERWEMICVAAESGEHGLREISAAQCAGSPFSLIVTDLMMPGMDGFQFIEKARKTEGGASVTILILTSAGHRGDGKKSQNLGVAGYLLKPVRKSELLEAICRVLGNPPADGERPLITRFSVLGAREPTTSLHILLAEDNLVNQKLAVRLLEKRGHRVAMAINGREALGLFEDKAFDLVLMDVQMPEMDGFQAVAEIRKVEEARGSRVRTPVIALTAHALVGDRERCIAAGMDGYLSKPLRPADLDDMLKKFSTPRKEILRDVEEPLHSK
jgi:PAS domain S-box-containing protein